MVSLEESVLSRSSLRKSAVCVFERGGGGEDALSSSICQDVDFSVLIVETTRFVRILQTKKCRRDVLDQIWKN